MARAAIPLVVQSPSNGSIIAGATVTITKTSDSSNATIYTSRTGGGTLGTNQVTSDGEGRLTSGGNEVFLEQGTYNFTISGTGLTTRTLIREIASGDGIVETFPVGGMLFWPGPALPAGFLRCDGSSLTRTTYPLLFKALTDIQQGTLTNAANTVTGLTDTSRMKIGDPVEGTGVAAGATIASITSGTAITLSANSTAGGAQTLTFFPHGKVSTVAFNLPDMRQRAAIGQATSGSGVGFGERGGEATHLLTTGEMPAHNHGVTDPGHKHDLRSSNVADGLPFETGTGAAPGHQRETGADPGSFTSTVSTGISTQNAGGGGSHQNMPPYLAGDWIVRHGNQ